MDGQFKNTDEYVDLITLEKDVVYPFTVSGIEHASSIEMYG